MKFTTKDQAGEGELGGFLHARPSFTLLAARWPCHRRIINAKAKGGSKAKRGRGRKRAPICLPVKGPPKKGPQKYDRFVTVQGKWGSESVQKGRRKIRQTNTGSISRMYFKRSDRTPWPQKQTEKKNAKTRTRRGSEARTLSRATRPQEELEHGRARGGAESSGHRLTGTI